MLLVEMLLVLQEVPLPHWFLPDCTPYDVVSVLHRLFPAFMNGGRCISGAFYVDRKTVRLAALDAVSASSKELTLRSCNLARSMLVQRLDCADQEADVLQESEDVDDEVEVVEAEGEGDSEEDLDERPAVVTSLKHRPGRVGIMEKQMAEVRRRVAAMREGRSGALAEMVEGKARLISDPANLRKATAQGWNSMGWLLLRDVSIYLVARFVFIKSN